MKFDVNLLIICCYCGSEDIDPENRIKRCRPIYNNFVKNKELVKVSSNKDDERRSIENVIKSNRTKRERTKSDSSNTSSQEQVL